MQENLCKIVREYVIQYEKPVVVNSGDKVRIEHKDPGKPEWKGWLWITDQNGNSGWAPSEYLDVKGDTAVFLKDYEATELNVSPGEYVTVISDVSGWLYCRKESGAIGWIPKENTDLAG